MRRHLWMRRWGALLGLGALGLGTAIWACGGGEYLNTVHFNTAEPDFGSPPLPVEIGAWELYQSRPVTWNGKMPDVDWERQAKEEEALANQLKVLNSNLDAQIRDGKFSEALATTRALIAALAKAPTYFYAAQEVSPLSALMDFKEVLESNAPRTAVSAYLNARQAYDKNAKAPIGPALQALVANPSAGAVRAHAAYLLAARVYDTGDFPAAAKQYRSVAGTYPASPRAESALIMAIRSWLRSPSQADDYVWVDSPLPQASATREARAALDLFDKRYPRSRFRFDASGWRARADYVENKIPAAILGYLAQSSLAENDDQRITNLSSIRVAMKKLKGTAATELGALLRKRPALVPAYVNYRIFYTETTPGDLDSLAQLSEAALASDPKTKFAPEVMAQLAQIEYGLKRWQKAVDWASKALSSGNDTPGQDLALYIRAGAKAKLKDAKGAQTDYLELEKKFPKSNLLGVTLENLALLAEARNDWSGALKAYHRLGYGDDWAYLLDVRLTVADLEKVVSENPIPVRRSEIQYALALRLIREDRYHEASSTLAKLPAAEIAKFGDLKDPSAYAWFGPEGTDRLSNPMDTVRDLKALQQKIDGATGDAKAEALYAKASYFYTKRNLLLYNPSLWKGGRAAIFASWNTTIQTPEDLSQIRKHMAEHECLAHSRRLCLEIVGQHPKSPVAAKALYRAACSARRLADFNYWWRSHNKQVDSWTEAIDLMKRIPKEYPSDPLAPLGTKFAKVFEEEKEMYGGDYGHSFGWELPE
ncbi:MAG TPA: hypothetical protein PLH94_04985 [Fimbriimonadaceae bacterium]|nr:hypothetical protein [Fimbriimonadaceae bacterium]